MTFRAPKGTNDILPPESDWWREAHRVWDALCEQFGYGLVLTPIFEDTEVFARGVGGDTEVVEKQMYTFDDKAGRSLTLRPEQTASVVRAQIQAGGVGSRFKCAYWGPMFRYERPQKGRYRQFYQAGVEYLGSASPEADVEVIELGYRFLERLGVENVELRLNSIGDPADRAAYREVIRAFLNERRDALSEDSVRRIDANPMRVLDSKADAEVVADAPTPVDHLGVEAQTHFDAVRAGLDAIGIPSVLDPRLVRGLDYYNRTVFEYVPLGYDAAQSAAGGGGRYDGLFEVLGGKPTPGVGLAMGLDRIELASAQRGRTSQLDAYVASIDESRRTDARALVSRLRSSGLKVETADQHRSVKAQFKDADRLGARFVVVIGDEFDDGMATVRSLADGEQRSVALENLSEWITSQ